MLTIENEFQITYNMKIHKFTFSYSFVIFHILIQTFNMNEKKMECQLSFVIWFASSFQQDIPESYEKLEWSGKWLLS